MSAGCSDGGSQKRAFEWLWAKAAALASIGVAAHLQCQLMALATADMPSDELTGRVAPGFVDTLEVIFWSVRCRVSNCVYAGVPAADGRAGPIRANA